MKKEKIELSELLDMDMDDMHTWLVDREEDFSTVTLSPKTPAPFGLLERLVKWLKADFEMTMYRIRPLRYCKGRGCYMKTPGRKSGVPYCLACQEDQNSLAT